MRFSEYFRYDQSADKAEKINVKGHVLKSLYKNVRIPWLLIIAGAVLAVFNSIVILTQYENYMAIFTGALTNLSPLFQYLAACFVQYLLIFASILSDIAFVIIVTGVRKKMWKKMVRLPLKDFEKVIPRRKCSPVSLPMRNMPQNPFTLPSPFCRSFYTLCLWALRPQRICLRRCHFL